MGTLTVNKDKEIFVERPFSRPTALAGLGSGSVSSSAGRDYPYTLTLYNTKINHFSDFSPKICVDE